MFTSREMFVAQTAAEPVSHVHVSELLWSKKPSFVTKSLTLFITLPHNNSI